jgi:glycosyltransferase involved in cell wall biosynthesis
VAGPFVEPELESLVLQTVRVLDGADYVGPKYDQAKAEFFDQIDVLVFPTKYADEAEPLTVLEAMAHAVPVIAWGRGCLPGMIPTGGGLVVETDRDFVSVASAQIATWVGASDRFAQVSANAAHGFQERAHRSDQAFEQLLRDLGASCPG